MTLKKLRRQEAILLSLKKLDYLTREQIQILHDLKSDRNAQRVLQEMSHWLASFNQSQGKRVYYLNKHGRERVGSDKVRVKITTVEHYLMRNDLYIMLGQPKEWRNEIRIRSGTENQKSKHEIVVVADAHYVKDNRHHIIEIDHTQKMNKNRIKIRKYRDLIQRGVFGPHMPKLMWVTISEYRRELLLDLCEGLDVDVFLPSEIKP